MSNRRIPAIVLPIAVVLFWVVLFIATHIHVRMPELRHLDKVMHCTAFTVLAALLAAFVRRAAAPPTWWKFAAVWLVLLIYGAFDEMLQTPPREPDVKDWLADGLGATIGVLAVACWKRIGSPRAENQASDRNSP